jgi:hypothetical protein
MAMTMRQLSLLYTGSVPKGLVNSDFYHPLPYLDFSPPPGQVLLERGWCPSEVEVFEDFASSYDVEIVKFFAGALQRPRMHQDHTGCSAESCEKDQIVEETYKTVHTTEECRCLPVEVQGKELESFLKENRIPTLFISEDLELEFVDSEEYPYVCISHVCELLPLWYTILVLINLCLGSHGRGNPFENSLPSCQLGQLREYISDLTENNPGLRLQGKRVALWIDTLCIPVALNLREQRLRAIGLLAKTYRDAAATLVLDRELEIINSRQVPLLELGLRILCSGWVRRLWTLQEGTLASHPTKEERKLYFQFLDGALRYETLQETEEHKLVAKYSHNRHRDYLTYYRDVRLALEMRLPCLMNLQKQELEDDQLGRFHDLCDAVSRRSCSKKEDEPICMATLMGLDLEEILKEETLEGRLGVFFQLMEAVPGELVFLRNVKKLQLEPFRWAPASLLTENDGLEKWRWYPTTRVGVCGETGLHVSYHGFIIAGTEQERVLDSRCVFRDSEDRTECVLDKIRSNDGSTTLLLPSNAALVFSNQKEYSNTTNKAGILTYFRAVVLDVEDKVSIDLPDESKTPRWQYYGTIVGHADFVVDDPAVGDQELLRLEGTWTHDLQLWCIT